MVRISMTAVMAMTARRRRTVTCLVVGKHGDHNVDAIDLVPAFGACCLDFERR